MQIDMERVERELQLAIAEWNKESAPWWSAEFKFKGKFYSDAVQCDTIQEAIEYFESEYRHCQILLIYRQRGS